MANENKDKVVRRATVSLETDRLQKFKDSCPSGGTFEISLPPKDERDRKRKAEAEAEAADQKE